MSINKFPNLKYLFLEECDVGVIKDLPTLKSLILKNCKIHKIQLQDLNILKIKNNLLHIDIESHTIGTVILRKNKGSVNFLIKNTIEKWDVKETVDFYIKYRPDL